MRFAGQTFGGGGNYISAGVNGMSSIDEINAKTSPDFGGLTQKMGRNKANESITGMQAMAKMQNAGLDSYAKTKASQFNAQATIARGEANAGAIQAEGMSSMLGSIGGGLTSAFGGNSGIGGKWRDAGSIGFEGNQVNDLGRLRY